MHLTQKTNQWVAQKIITRKQQESILAHESRVRLPYVTMMIMWIGIFCIALGLGSIISMHWDTIPESVKLTVGAVCLGGGLGLAAWFARRESHLLAEMFLFVAFLMVGGGIGLIAQIFDLPFGSATGLLVWAVISMGIALVCRSSLLSFLWIPLFIGGILGFLKLELLLLFFEQAPVFATIVLGGILLAVIYLTGLFKNKFINGVYIWSLILFFAVMLVGTTAHTDTLVGFLISAVFLAVLGVFSVLHNRRRLFQVVSAFFGWQLVYFYFQHFDRFDTAGIGLTLSGLVIFLVGGIWFYKNRWEK